MSDAAFAATPPASGSVIRAVGLHKRFREGTLDVAVKPAMPGGQKFPAGSCFPLVTSRTMLSRLMAIARARRTRASLSGGLLTLKR
jgi:hypothetical protein